MNWKQEYDKWLSGVNDKRIEELNGKYDKKTITKEEYAELKTILKTKNNVGKVTNILEFRKQLENDVKKIKQELSRRENSVKYNDQITEIEEEHNKLIQERINVKKEFDSKINVKGLKPEQKEEIKKEYMLKINEIDDKVSINNRKYQENQNNITTNKKLDIANKFAGKTNADLDKKVFELGTKISKINAAANLLMNGKGWDEIGLKFDNWENRKQKLTAKEKYTERAEAIKGNEIVSGISDKVAKIKKEMQNEKNTENKEETALVPQSKFARKHPRLAKIFNFFKNRKTRKENKLKANELDSIDSDEKKAVKDNEFKTYLKEIAEKGMTQVKNEQLAKMREKALAKETEKFDGRDKEDEDEQEIH